MRERSPTQGGKMVGGPFFDKVMAFDRPMMPVTRDGARIGCYHWVGDRWIWEDELEGQHTWTGVEE